MTTGHAIPGREDRGPLGREHRARMNPKLGKPEDWPEYCAGFSDGKKSVEAALAAKSEECERLKQELDGVAKYRLAAKHEPYLKWIVRAQEAEAALAVALDALHQCAEHHCDGYDTPPHRGLTCPACSALAKIEEARK